MIFPIESAFESDRDLLIAFVDAYEKQIMHVLGFTILSDRAMPFVGEKLRKILGDEGKREITQDFVALRNASRETSDDVLSKHGLLGPQLRFKLAYIYSIEENLYQGGTFFFDKVFGKSLGDVCDTVIDSLIDATGAGTGVKEIGDLASDVIGQGVDG